MARGLLRQSIEATFEYRDTHPVPEGLPEPPTFWRRLYAEMRAEDELPWQDLAALHAFCSDFLDPLLARTAQDDQIWTPDEHRWRAGDTEFG